MGLLLGAAAPARAGTPELRIALARLIETLDAGLTRADLRTLRIDANAEIRVQKLSGINTLAELDEMAKALTATDQVWAILLGMPACQAAQPGTPVNDGTACAAQLLPNLQALGLTPPDMAAPLNQGSVLQPALQALRRQAERTLRTLR
jgi:hypothetical protein